MKNESPMETPTSPQPTLPTRSKTWIYIVITAIVTAVLVGGLMYVFGSSTTSSVVEEEVTEEVTEVSGDVTIASIVENNCTLSGGTFLGGTCDCPSDSDLDLYDESTGFCQVEIGGPGGVFLEHAQTKLELLMLENSDDKKLAIGETDSLRFEYDDTNEVFSDYGFWDREVFERLGAVESDVQPHIRIQSREGSEDDVEKFAISDFSLGDVESVQESDIIKDRINSSGYKIIDNRSVLWVTDAGLFDIRTYYFYEGGKVHSISTNFSTEENLKYIESIIESIEVK